MDIVYEWIIDNLKTGENKRYINSYRLYKKIQCISKDFYFNESLEPEKFKLLRTVLNKKAKLLFEMPTNTIYYPYSFCPINTLHSVLETRIRSATVYQCGICNSIIVPKRYG